MIDIRSIKKKNVRFSNFRPGQRVWLYTNRSPPGLKASKLHIKHTGPWYIVSQDDCGNFRLRNCENNKLLSNPVHPDRLKDFNDDRQQCVDPPMDQRDSSLAPSGTGDNQPASVSSAPYKQAEKLIGIRTRRGQKFYRVQWQDGSPHEWVEAADIPANLIEKFHVNKTLKGTKRKRKSH